MKAEAALRWSLPSRPASAGLARHHVGGCCDGLGRDLRDIAMLLTTELVSNAIEHGEGEIELVVTRPADRLRVEVHDRSSGRPVPRSADADSARGRGLLLVERLASEWGVQPSSVPGGKQVWFQLRVPPGR